MMALLLMLSLFTLAFPLRQPELFVSPRIRAGATSSLNWSGYAVTGPAGSVTDAKSSWVVPAIVGTCPSTNQYSSFWVGIDGYSSSTVEQTGTDSDCQNGTPTYYAWFEFYPKPAFLINTLTISPGDKISAEVTYQGGVFTVSITDVTTGQSFSTSARINSAQRSSAEWIAEAPSSSGGILPLANFGAVNFGFDYTVITSTCFATLGGTTGSIASFGSSVQQITMVDSSGTIIAQPSSLSTDGTSFSVQRVTSTTGSFDFSLSVNPGSASVAQGGSTTATVTVSLVGGTTQTVSLSTFVSPAETTISTSLSPSSGSPTFTSLLSATTAGSTPAGTYTITITGTGGGVTHSTSFTLTVATAGTSQSLLVNVSTDKTSYTQNSWAYITVKVTSSTGSAVAGATVTVTVTDPNGGTATGTSTTDSNGFAHFKYRISPNALLGTYTVTSTASASGYNSGSGSTTFQVS